MKWEQKGHLARLYICHQIYHSVVKNCPVLSFSTYGSKNKSVKIHNTNYFWKIPPSVCCKDLNHCPWSHQNLQFLFTDSTINCDILSLNITWISYHTPINNNTSWKRWMKLSVFSCIFHFTSKFSFHAPSLSVRKLVLVCKINVCKKF